MRKKKQPLTHNTLEHREGITGPRKDKIINCQLCHFFRPIPNPGLGIAKGLGVEVDEPMMTVLTILSTSKAGPSPGLLFYL